MTAHSINFRSNKHGIRGVIAPYIYVSGREIMQLDYYDLSSYCSNLKEVKICGTKINVLYPKEFKEYKKEAEKNGNRVSVLRNTSLKRCKKLEGEDYYTRDPEILDICGLKFKLKDEESKSDKYYIPVDEFDFVRVECKPFFLIPLLFLVFVILPVCTLLYYGSADYDNDDVINPIKLAETIRIREHEEPIDENQKIETTTFPGYAHLHVDKDYPFIYLSNPKENTVHMTYEIYNEGKLLVKSDAVAPGTELPMNIRKFLKPGNYVLQFSIKTFDVSTMNSCNSVSQDVDITID